jgi:catechol 2,3-dioxygenase-like lactoylglutathione lyase family enzyme
MRLRQIALVARDLAAARGDIEAVLGLSSPYADPAVAKYGLSNAVWPIGDTFLEVVSPVAEGTTAGQLLDKRGGDGGYMAIFQTRDIAAARARVAAAGVRIVDQADGERFAMTHLHPKDTGGAIVSIDAMVPEAHWEWAGPSWRGRSRNPLTAEIVGAEIQAADPEAVARRWAEVLGGAPEAVGALWRLPLEGGEVRFTTLQDDRGEGLAAFDVAARDAVKVRRLAQARGRLDRAGHISLCGTRVRLV